MQSLTAPHRQCVARERGPAYSAGHPSVAGALAKLREARAERAALDPQDCSRDEVAQALTTLAREQQQLAEVEVRLLRDFDRREGFRRDGCVSTQGWLKLTTGLGHAGIKRRLQRVRLLRRMPLLEADLRHGEITTDHVDAIAKHATPGRLDRIAEHEETLTALACNADPRDVRVAVRRIVEALDDGPDDPPACSDEDLRELRVTRGLRDLCNVEGTGTPLLHELLARTRDLYSTPDTPDTPVSKRRTPAQKWHDALVTALSVAIRHHSTRGAVDGVRTHAVLFADLFTLLGRDELARMAPRLSAVGQIDAETARHLIATTNPTLRLVLGLGPWLPVAVGRARRTLPDWLRGASQMVHKHCRGPGCDRPFAWCEADHLDEWWSGGSTALSNAAPMCTAHNNLKHTDRWTVTFDVETGVVTWVSRDETRRINLPPPDP
ncbi:MAG: DUF222 domain-containing protein [Nitriliruptorales bacterium]|nr:DUF222 domain-containing protein [Nitriliruptorales bacterium]